MIEHSNKIVDRQMALVDLLISNAEDRALLKRFIATAYDCGHIDGQINAYETQLSNLKKKGK